MTAADAAVVNLTSASSIEADGPVLFMVGHATSGYSLRSRPRHTRALQQCL